jgi:Ca2+-binding EF-hand superfamily protein
MRIHLPRDISELVEVMKRLKYDPSMVDLQQCFVVDKRLSVGNSSKLVKINIVNFVKLIFKAYDKDHSGYICAPEWSDALNKITNSNLPQDKATEMFKLEKYDLDGDGKLSFEEFVCYINDTTLELSDEHRELLKALFPDTLDIPTLFESIGISLTDAELQEIDSSRDKQASSGDIFEYNYENMCKALFKYTDKNNDGYISANEMQILIGKIMGTNEPVNLEDAKTLIETVDENADGRLDYREFIAMFVKLAEWKETISG